jgi:hypothetical protein
MASHSNSSSIEAVFAAVCNMRRDTPQGVLTAMTVYSFTKAVKLLSKQGAIASYDGTNIPDQATPSKDVLGWARQ